MNKLKSWQKKLEKIISWNQNNLRFTNTVKYRVTVEGGLAIPQLIKCYDAFQLAQAVKVVQMNKRLDWIQMEKVGEHIINSYLYSTKLSVKKRSNSKPLS